MTDTYVPILSIPLRDFPQAVLVSDSVRLPWIQDLQVGLRVSPTIHNGAQSVNQRRMGDSLYSAYSAYAKIKAKMNLQLGILFVSSQVEFKEKFQVNLFLTLYFCFK